MLIAILLGLPPLAWFLFFFAIAWLVLGTLLGFFFGRFIAAGEAPLEPVAPGPLSAEPASPADLDDWLAAEEPLRDFKVWKRPTASTYTGEAR